MVVLSLLQTAFPAPNSFVARRWPREVRTSRAAELGPGLGLGSCAAGAATGQAGGRAVVGFFLNGKRCFFQKENG